MHHSESNRTVAFLLCLLGFVFVAGIHRFYTGKIWTGLLWLLTGGLAGVGTVFDLVMIGVGRYRDKQGYLLS